MADGSTKKIEDVSLGDEVTATDPSTGAAQPKPVTTLWLNHDTELTDVTVRVVVSADANAKPAAPSSSLSLVKAGAALIAAAAAVVGATTVLHTTQHHPFWDRTTNTWVNAADLEPGDELKTDDGATVEVTDVHNFTDAKDMRDLTVADVHTYYVLAAGEPILVHNTNPTSNQGNLCSKAAAAAERAEEVQDFHLKQEPNTDEIADKQRVVAVTTTDGGPDFVGGGVRDLRPGQRDMLHPGERATKQPGGHAEVTSTSGAVHAGHDPNAIGTSKDFCDLCELLIQETGGIVHGPRTATWPNGFGGPPIDPKYFQD